MAKITINKERCKGCELCVMYCPKGLIIVSDSINSYGIKTVRFNDVGKCTGCTMCAIMCPDCAIEVWR